MSVVLTGPTITGALVSAGLPVAAGAVVLVDFGVGGLVVGAAGGAVAPSDGTVSGAADVRSSGIREELGVASADGVDVDESVDLHALNPAKVAIVASIRPSRQVRLAMTVGGLRTRVFEIEV